MIFWELFWTFFQIGAFTFGGGYAMLPLIQSEVTAKGWLSSTELVNFVAVSESTPGPFAVNMATYVGAETAGFWGAVCATLGGVLPSFVIILIVAGCYDRFRKSRFVSGCMAGLKPAVVGMIASAALSVAGTVFFPAGALPGLDTLPALIVSVIIFLAVLVSAMKKIHPIVLVVLSAAAGIAAGCLGWI